MSHMMSLQAQVRAGKGRPVTIEPSKAPIGHPVIDSLIPEGSEYSRSTLNYDMVNVYIESCVRLRMCLCILQLSVYV